MIERMAAAVHEAAHLVASETVGPGWLRATIGLGKTGQTMGEAIYASGSWSADLARAFAAIAGPAAQKRAVGHMLGSYRDMETAAGLIRARYGARADLAGIFRTMTLLVNVWLDRRDVWNRIENLAARLLEQKQVLADEPASQQAAACVPTALVDVRYLAAERASWATWRDSGRRGTSRGGGGG